MVARRVAICLTFLAACAMASVAQAKKHKGLHGTVVSISATKIVINVKADATDKVGTEQTFDVSPNVSITVNGQSGEIKDIQPMDMIIYKLDNAKKVVTDINKGHRKRKKKDS